MAEETKQISYYEAGANPTSSCTDISIRSAREKTIYIKHATEEKTWSIAADAAHISNLLKRDILDKADTDTYGLSDKNPIIVDNINKSKIMYNNLFKKLKIKVK